MKKYIAYCIVIGIAATMVGLGATLLVLSLQTKKAVPVRAELTISKPIGSNITLNEKKLPVAGKASIGGGVTLSLKDRLGRAIFTPNPIKAGKDGHFEAEVPFNEPGQYSLTVSSIEGTQQHTIAINIPEMKTPPYFVVSGIRMKDKDSVTLTEGEKLRIIVRDDDNKLSSVWNKKISDAKEYSMEISSSSEGLKPGENRIVAADATGMRSSIIVFLEPIIKETEQTPPAVTKVTTDTPETVTTTTGTPGTVKTEEPGKVITVIEEPEELAVIPDKSPPYFEYNSQRYNNQMRIEIQAGNDLKVAIKDDESGVVRVRKPNNFTSSFSPSTNLPLEILSKELKIGENRILATDKEGNESTLIVTVREEQEKPPPPPPTDATPPYFVYNNQKLSTIELGIGEDITISVKDDGTGLSSVWKTSNLSGRKGYDLKISSSALNPGNNTITATDLSGNSSSFIIQNKVDETPPFFSINGQKQPKGATIYVRADSIVNIQIDDDNALKQVGPARITGKQYKISSSDIDIGTHNIQAKDMSDNETALTIIKYQPVKLQIDSPKNGLVTNASRIRVSGKVINGLGGKTLKINDKSVPAASGTIDIEVQLNEGSNKITAFAQDDRDTSNTETIEVIKDTMPPEFVDADGDKVEGEILRQRGMGDQYLRITIKDDGSGISKVELNDSPQKIDTSKKPLTIQLSDAVLDENNTITIWDNAGNKNSTSIKVYSDDTGLWKEVDLLYKQGKYDEVWGLVDRISRKSKTPVPGMPFANLYKGIISYKNGDKIRDSQKSDQEYYNSTEFLKDAWTDRDKYSSNSLAAENNLYYWGMALYKRWIILKQSPLDLTDKVKRTAREAQLTSFLNDANDKLQEFTRCAERNKTENRTRTMYNQAQKSLNEISKSLPKTK